MDNGLHIGNNKSWVRNSCESCVCQHGWIYCQTQRCPLHCEYPRTVVGVCCPICGGQFEPYHLCQCTISVTLCLKVGLKKFMTSYIKL